VGRPALEFGKPGRITVRETKPKLFEARCRYRDVDGAVRRIAAQGKSRTAAQNALLAKIEERPWNGGKLKELRPESRFTDAAALWLAQIEQTQRATTHQAYRQWLVGRVIPDIGEMRLREVRVGYLDAYFTRLRIQGYTPNTLRMIRKVVRGPLQLAVEHEVIPANPVSNIKRIGGSPKQARALTPEERNRLRSWLEGSSEDPEELLAQDAARRRDMPDVVRTMLGTGLRVGELLGLRWSNLHLDADVAVLNVTGNVARVRGVGVVFHPGKTPSAIREMPLPPFVVAALKARRARLGLLAADDLPVFCVVRASGPSWHDPAKVTGWVREIRKWVGLEWMTTHTWRKTAATMLDEAGFSARQIADQMGHAQISMTQNTYLGRKGEAVPEMATALESAWEEQVTKDDDYVELIGEVIPNHLRFDGTDVKAQCLRCQRWTWSYEQFGQECRMTQPDGFPCGGQFTNPLA
jgi:integrase